MSQLPRFKHHCGVRQPLLLKGVAVACFLAALLAGRTAVAQSSSLIDLGLGVEAYGINASGQITGCMPAANGTVHAFLYQLGVFTDLGTLSGGNSCGFALNASGQVTGYSLEPSAAPTWSAHAFLYTGGVMQDLGLGGAFETVGTAINASGAVTGYAVQGPGFPPLASVNGLDLAQSLSGFVMTGGSAFLYTNGAMTTIAAKPDFQGSYAGTAIDDSGTVAGLSVRAECTDLCPNAVAFLYLNGAASELMDATVYYSTATGISASGQVIAYGEDGDGVSHGLIFENASVVDLGNNTRANAVSSSGQIAGLLNVGLYHQIGLDAQVFVYNSGLMTTFAMPGAVPAAINDGGWIVANNATLKHAYVLQPSPVSVQPTGLLFGNQAVGTLTSEHASCGACTVTVTNSTGATVAMSSPVIVGPFAQTGITCGTSLAASASCTVSLSYAPTQVDAAVGAMSVSVGGTTYATLLSGTGTIAVSLNSSAPSIKVGIPFTLTWTATTGSACSTTGGALAYNNASLDGWSGTQQAASGAVSLTESAAGTLSFTITCTNGSQTASATTSVAVTAPSSGGGGGLDEVTVLLLAVFWRTTRSERQHI